jgi:hypothetical protein
MSRTIDLTGQRFATNGFTRGGAIGGPPSSADVHTMSHIERILNNAQAQSQQKHN